MISLFISTTNVFFPILRYNLIIIQNIYAEKTNDCRDNSKILNNTSSLYTYLKGLFLRKLYFAIKL